MAKVVRVIARLGWLHGWGGCMLRVFRIAACAG